mmetsp:Transcript_18052/g.60873  ORF Transcript_18052/g.60873 Transcript_18052/m.60873 type:complete len:388 (+) Transcript_18052:1413-2576(+)
MVQAAVGPVCGSACRRGAQCGRDRSAQRRAAQIQRRLRMGAHIGPQLLALDGQRALVRARAARLRRPAARVVRRRLGAEVGAAESFKVGTRFWPGHSTPRARAPRRRRRRRRVAQGPAAAAAHRRPRRLERRGAAHRRLPGQLWRLGRRAARARPIVLRLADQTGRRSAQAENGLLFSNDVPRDGHAKRLPRHQTRPEKTRRRRVRRDAGRPVRAAAVDQPGACAAPRGALSARLGQGRRIPAALARGRPPLRWPCGQGPMLGRRLRRRLRAGGAHHVCARGVRGVVRPRAVLGVLRLALGLARQKARFEGAQGRLARRAARVHAPDGALRRIAAGQTGRVGRVVGRFRGGGRCSLRVVDEAGCPLAAGRRGAGGLLQPRVFRRTWV